MGKRRSPGLDELMIVNPGLPGGSTSGEALFLGEDGLLYQVQGLGQEDELRGLRQFFLGEDGTLYQVQGTDLDGLDVSADFLGEGDCCGSACFFLGEDGRLYEVVGR
jgi:hypothetical protein